MSLVGCPLPRGRSVSRAACTATANGQWDGSGLLKTSTRILASTSASQPRVFARPGAFGLLENHRVLLR